MRTEHAIEQYRQIVQNGGWSKVPAGRTLKLGSSGSAVLALRKRLIVSGDLDASPRAPRRSSIPTSMPA